MLAITQATRATDIALVKIAKAFLRQTFPLTEEGRSLKQDISRVLELNDFPWLRSNVWQLPTFEHPHLKLFAELNFGDLTEREVMGHKLVTVQCHRGCSHDCEGFCDSDAPRRIVQRMPTLGLYRIAQAKTRYDCHYGRIMWNWHGLIRKMGIIDDEREFDQKIQHDDMTVKEFLRVLIEVDQLCDLHPIAQHLRRWPINELADTRERIKSVWANYQHYIPVLLNSMRQNIMNWHDNDPLEFVGTDLLHFDGEPVDYGDLYNIFTSTIRPIFISTAGWLAQNQYAERAVGKILDTYSKNHFWSGGIRLTIKRYEKLARTDYPAYLQNLKRMLKILWPLRPHDLELEFYHDWRIEHDKDWADATRRALNQYAQEELGGNIDDIANMNHVSRRQGRAYDPDASDDHNSVDIWGYHILPDGRVIWREENVWTKHVFQKETYYRLEPPCPPKDTGVKLW